MTVSISDSPFSGRRDLRRCHPWGQPSTPPESLESAGPLPAAGTPAAGRAALATATPATPDALLATPGALLATPGTLLATPGTLLAKPEETKFHDSYFLSVLDFRGPQTPPTGRLD